MKRNLKRILSCCMVSMIFLSGCRQNRELNIKITRFSEAYPQFLEDCPLNDNVCTISGGNEEGIFYTLNFEGHVILKQFDFKANQAITLYEYDDDCTVDTMIEKEGIYYYTEEKRIPMDIENIENIQNPYVIQYSIKALQAGQSSTLISGTYPNYNDRVSLKVLGDTLMMITPDFSYNEGFTEIDTYGYKVNLIHGLELETILHEQAKWKDTQDSEMWIPYLNQVHSISDQFIMITTNNIQTCFTELNESGLIKDKCIDNDHSNKFILQSAGNTVIYEELLNNYPYQSNYFLYEIDAKDSIKLDKYPKLLHAESLNDKYLYAFGHNDEDKMYYKKVHYLIEIKEGDLLLHKLDIDEEAEQLTSRMIAENKAILVNSLHGSDVYMIEW